MERRSPARLLEEPLLTNLNYNGWPRPEIGLHFYNIKISKTTPNKEFILKG